MNSINGSDLYVPGFTSACPCVVGCRSQNCYKQRVVCYFWMVKNVHLKNCYRLPVSLIWWNMFPFIFWNTFAHLYQNTYTCWYLMTKYFIVSYSTEVVLTSTHINIAMRCPVNTLLVFRKTDSFGDDCFPSQRMKISPRLNNFLHWIFPSPHKKIILLKLLFLTHHMSYLSTDIPNVLLSVMMSNKMGMTRFYMN